MIVKFFEINKKNIKDNKYFLLYGNNQGLIEETLEKSIKPNLKGNIFKYDENEVIKDIETFNENISNKSFFDNEKIIIINKATDKILSLIKEVVDNDIRDISSKFFPKRYKFPYFYTPKSFEELFIKFIPKSLLNFSPHC